MGNHIKTEKVNMKGWQKLFGKSISYRAPGMFMELLRKAAIKCNAVVEEFSTWTTALSQRCHCGQRVPKTLGDDHACSCGVAMQRDLYSAFLAQYVEADRLVEPQAQAAWREQAASLLHATRTGWKDWSPPVAA
jgi:hypothetical protein